MGRLRHRGSLTGSRPHGQLGEVGSADRRGTRESSPWFLSAPSPGSSRAAQPRKWRGSAAWFSVGSGTFCIGITWEPVRPSDSQDPLDPCGLHLTDSDQPQPQPSPPPPSSPPPWALRLCNCPGRPRPLPYWAGFVSMAPNVAGWDGVRPLLGWLPSLPCVTVRWLL